MNEPDADGDGDGDADDGTAAAAQSDAALGAGRGFEGVCLLLLRPAARQPGRPAAAVDVLSVWRTEAPIKRAPIVQT